ncbi:Gamma-glutamyltranspeptidase precursor [Tritonibacter multivorans]|uniref:Glutathione hydrolase proenzyme n=1 Tax=Tritonibacter multivorans TaxID=928856 RepID=A0A0P1FZW4_9RHOB|nr:gamma-glutamyltransferase [Tritonibacter multivorans]MDA7422431.1 gamma-glutamyltransferase [Tritonibacter multivorans]CUH74954.1 Gamma-glutamyltranspeptidase precursor [Tritonibacter multivorans]SFD44177.1 gamma-glutamyltranspeptidase / glutathione hydrolase [Tritonibacter multivorans]
MLRMVLSGVAFAALVSGAVAQDAADAVAPEGATALANSGFSDTAMTALALRDAGQVVEADNWMVAAANPHAVEAGAKILRAGGTAADAMVAVQVMLGLVEPQSSGLGGGAFLVYYDAKTGGVTTLDGRETAPLAATPRLFQDETGVPLKFFDAVVGGLSVGTPGTPALLEAAHRKWGRANWSALFEDAIAMAEGGFAVSPRMAASVARDAERLARFPETASYFLPDGEPLAEGQILTNTEYADTLRALAEQGTAAFYSGAIAADIVRTVQDAPGNPGVLNAMDLALYQVKERPATCSTYRSFDVCGMGPPSSGALTVGQILGMLNVFDMAELGADNPISWRLIGDASRLAFADRGRYMADSDYVPVPTGGLVNADYLAKRANLMRRETALETVEPGTPEFDHALNWADDESLELPSTSHISIVDADGNVLSMTTTIENGFGSRLMTNGFLLNNELTDFSFRTQRDGVPIANRLEPGKRPRSSMSPTIVLEEGAPVLAIGSPGGSRIIGYVAKTIVAWADWDMDLQAALALPHAVNRFGTYDLEAGTAAETLSEPLSAMGFEVNLRDLNSGLHAIEIGDTLKGAADPRREGIALGG